MAKPITCISRDARQYCSDWTEKNAMNTSSWQANDECRKYICTKLLEDSNVWDISESEPLFFSEKYRYADWGNYLSDGFWLFKNRIFVEDDDLDFTLEEKKLLVREEFDKERRQFEKLHAKFSSSSTASQNRNKIPSNVRIFVWQRDSGKCVECGSNENLEYDHIIPFIKGGSNTERNLQLLCGTCNRLKSDNIQ